MHKIEIPQYALDRIQLRRGRFHQFDRLDPKRTAHIVVDLQNGFMAEGQVGEVAAAREIVPNVNRISRALRAAGGLVIYIQNTIDGAALSDWTNYFNFVMTPTRRARMTETFTPGKFRPRDLGRARGAAAGSQGAQAPVRRVRARLLGSP
ncbi:MAG: cysteine hydrolase family protein [Pseudomonadota bacterium]